MSWVVFSVARFTSGFLEKAQPLEPVGDASAANDAGVLLAPQILAHFLGDCHDQAFQADGLAGQLLHDVEK